MPYREPGRVLTREEFEKLRKRPESRPSSKWLPLRNSLNNLLRELTKTPFIRPQIPPFRETDPFTGQRYYCLKYVQQQLKLKEGK